MQTQAIAEELQSFISELKKAWVERKLVKLTLSKSSQDDLTQIFGVLVEIKQELKLKLTYRYKTKDETKNLSFDEIESSLNDWIPSPFKNAHLITDSEEFTLLFSKKYKASLIQKKRTIETTTVLEHNRQKERWIALDTPFLMHLGVTDAQGNLIPKMADKYKQINRYIEIIDDHLKQVLLPEGAVFVDMGSGKGYLTFALYQYLESKNKNAKVIGVELRPELVKKCSDVAEKCAYKNLSFLSKRIEDFKPEEMDVLIALHACDTATDDAIAAGIKAECDLIICAPCCHKQVRQSIDKQVIDNPILRYGIFTERSCEMLTDTIRAMVLESKGYKTKVFEFISNEHTRKNVMLTAIKTNTSKDISADLTKLKEQYGLEKHYLEGLV